VIGGPRGSFILPATFDWHLLIGDATAIPAIARRLEELPADARVIVIIEVESAADTLQLASGPAATVHWIYRSEMVHEEPLLSALPKVVFPDGDYHAWIACESATAK